MKTTVEQMSQREFHNVDVLLRRARAEFNIMRDALNEVPSNIEHAEYARRQMALALRVALLDANGQSFDVVGTSLTALRP